MNISPAVAKGCGRTRVRSATRAAALAITRASEDLAERRTRRIEGATAASESTEALAAMQALVVAALLHVSHAASPFPVVLPQWCGLHELYVLAALK